MKHVVDGSPDIPRRILEAALPPGPLGQAILGDLHEEFTRRAEDSPARARLWYWREALAVAARYAWRASGRRDPRATRPAVYRTRGKGMGDVMDGMWMNVRYAVRRLLKAPLFTLVAVVSLGLGIGANTAIFSIVDAAILRKLPFRDPGSLVDVYQSAVGFSAGPLSFPDEEDMARDAGDVFSAVGGSHLALIQTDVEGGGVEMLPAEGVSGSYFPMTGVKAAVGRLFTPEDQVARGAAPVAILGYGYWQRRYAGDPGVLGTEIRLGGRPYTIIGVVPRDYVGQIRGLVPAIYFPILQYEELQPGAEIIDGRGSHGFWTKARLKPGVTFAQAQAALDRMAGDFRRDYPKTWDSDAKFNLVPTQQVVVNPMIDRVLLPAIGMVMVVVGLVLLIACANLASFLLARAADRRKEIAVRLAMGASRRALMGQLLTETVLLSLLGGGLGVGIAAWGVRALLGADLPLPFPISLDVALDGKVLGFTLLVSLLAGVLFGLAPALQGTRVTVASTLRDESAGGGRGRGSRLRGALVVTQVAVSVVLLTGAGLFLRSLNASRNIDPGFGHEPAGIVELVTPPDRYTDDQGRVYFRQLEEKIAALPGVKAVGLISNLHMNTMNTVTSRVKVEGVEPPPGQDYWNVDYTVMDAGFMDAGGLRLIEGRNFDATDVAGGRPVILVNEAFARKFFPGESPVGRTVNVRDEDRTVVGVVATAKIRHLGEEPRPFVYGNFDQAYNDFGTVVASTTGDAGALTLSMVQAARSLDPEIMVVQSFTMARHLAVMLLPRRLGALVVAGFACLALVLACIGLYGVVSYAVARRAREVGIRLSLGAESGDVVWMLTGGGMRLVLLGGVLGLLVSGLLAQGVSRLLYGVPAIDPVTFVGVPLVLGAVAFLASWIPARRASRVDPVSALRAE